jgi:inositol-pentakisphosphate 2-kinase
MSVVLTRYRVLSEHPTDLIIEFKPKWLTQSPNAPSGAIRCRNCAREAYRFNQKKIAQPGVILCPLDLLRCRKDPAALQQVVDHIIPNHYPVSAGQLDRLVTWLKTNSLMERLRDAQIQNDPYGPLKAMGSTNDGSGYVDMMHLALAMTLRDCTCFLRIQGNDAHAAVEAKLADLDKKNGLAKLAYWQATEHKLAGEGYYMGTEEPKQKTTCQLERMASHS